MSNITWTDIPKNKNRLRIVDVAINRCYGGFDLSEKAKKRICEIKGKEYSIFIERDDPDLIRVIKELGKEVNTEYSKIV